MQQQKIHRISFIGLGLIGTSLMQALKRAAEKNGWTIEMIGFDPRFSKKDIRAIKKIYGLNRFEVDKVKLYDADIIVLCAPVRANIALLNEVKQFASARTLVTDVSSTKTDIDKEAKKLGINFIGMHPIAGREQQGYQAASPELLVGRKVIICSGDKLPKSGRAAELVKLLRAAGCKPYAMSPVNHDRVFANISHLPQLISTLLTDHCKDYVEHSGTGFASATRLAGSNWPVWHDIVETNRTNIASELNTLSELLAQMASEVQSKNDEALKLKFRKANEIYHRLRKKGMS